MDRQAIFNKVKEILDEQGADTNNITFSSTFKDDLGLDSMDQFELVMALEEAYGRNIPDEDASKLITVGDAVDYISVRML